MQDIDYLIVGAGTAGAVLASRLSEDPGRQVLVLEAGPDYPDEPSLPAALRDTYVTTGATHDWGLEVSVCGNRSGRLGRGKVVGGSSQTNAAGAIRAPAADFEAWAGLGLPEWGWSHVLPAYCRVEADQQFGDRDYHGSEGPVPITRWPEDELIAPMAGLLEAAQSVGHSFCEDVNAPEAEGIGLYPQNRRGRLRISTNLAYLAPARERPNLRVRGGVRVDRVVLEGDTATGVEAGGEVIRAREVILCAGAPFSPALLMRSGIGEKDELDVIGVAQRAEVPGVGTGLMDQPGAVIPIVPVPDAGEVDGPTLQVFARLSAFPGYPRDGAFYLCLFAGMDLANDIPQLASLAGAPVANLLMVGDMRTASKGRMSLRSADPAELPSVTLGFYATASDLGRMRSAYRHGWEIVNHHAFRRTVERFPFVGDELICDDAQLDQMLRMTTNSRFNLLGGCAMGTSDDPLAVVDQHCRVRGVRNLRVVDASIVPVPLRAPAALTCMMLGERVAPWVAAGS